MICQIDMEQMPEDTPIKMFWWANLYISYLGHLEVIPPAEEAPVIAPYPTSQRSYAPPGVLGPGAALSGHFSVILPAQRGDPP